MILSFRCRRTGELFRREGSNRFKAIERPARRKLEFLQAAMPKLSPIHPGEILAEEFLAPLGITQYRLAVDLGVPPRRINEIVLGRRGISADTALRLAHYFGNSAEFWMNLQSRYDLLVEQDRIGNSLAKAPRHDSVRLVAAQQRSPYRMSKAKTVRNAARRRH